MSTIYGEGFVADMTTPQKLSKTQAELLEAMRNGVVCHYMRYMGNFRPVPYYFRNDTMRRCTAAVNALLEKGLAEEFDKKFGGDHKVRAKGQP